MVTITKAELLETIWKTIKDRMEADVTSVTLADATTQTIQTYTSSFPDIQNETKADYPILVIEPVQMTASEQYTLKCKWRRGMFTVEVYATKSETANLFLDAMIESIETYRDTLAGLTLSDVNLDSTNTETVFRGDIKVHIASATFTWRFPITKTFP